MVVGLNRRHRFRLPPSTQGASGRSASLGLGLAGNFNSDLTKAFHYTWIGVVTAVSRRQAELKRSTTPVA